MTGSAPSRKKFSAERYGAFACATVLAAVVAGGGARAQAPQELRPYIVVDDAIPEPLTGAKATRNEGVA
jgi:hypothetical protein